jgi:nucleolar protein 56
MGGDYVLFEAASGYALVEVVEFEQIGSSTEQVQQTVADLQKFSRLVKLKAFYPFESAEEALSNINAISEHIVPKELANFLELQLPDVKKSSKKSKGFSLGLIDPMFASAVQETTGFPCKSDDTIREVLRGVRLHLTHFIKELGNGNMEQAQLGLGHSYSRCKVKFNPGREDNMIIQAICLLDQLDKDVNTFAMRVREWYSYHFPELIKLVSDNYTFAKCAEYIGDRTTFTEDKVAGLGEICMDEDIAQSVFKASQSSMGMDCSAIDMLNIMAFTQRMVKLAEYRLQLSEYLQNKLSTVSPNLATLVGDTVAARLISKAGSLVSLAKCPASTVQILGAEKALFRALKKKGNTPKYGLIYHSTFIGRASTKNKGRISRYLANKCAIAARIDSFIEDPTTKYGESLRDQVEERLAFYDSGKSPKKNIDVMTAVSKALAAEAASNDPSSSSATSSEKKSKKKRKADDDDEEKEAGVSTEKKQKKEKKEKKEKKDKKDKKKKV